MINDHKRKLKERKGRSNERNLKERERGFQRKNGGSISDHTEMQNSGVGVIHQAPIKKCTYSNRSLESCLTVPISVGGSPPMTGPA
jgi:hypothetical protein